MKKFSNDYKSSTKPGKQRLYRLNAPLHRKRKMTKSTLSSELRKKYNMRNITIRTEDKIKVMRGRFRGQTGKVDSVDLKSGRVTVEGIDLTKKDGNKVKVKIDASNIMITELSMSDKKRITGGKNAKTTS
ncbi:50S ribosomal protein L24 [Candidatus Woesearchaeota archaeon]|nr:50S ribosomal protein L24 [Candidatus Woesearchaeota archaeon]